MKKNEEYVVNVIDNGYQGEGIAKIDGIPVFIPNAIQGEEAKIKILKVLKSMAYGKVISVLKESNRRNVVDCATFDRCGGCSLRHIKYNETLKLKKDIVENNLKKAGLLNATVNDCIGMQNPYNYRNKLQYPVGLVEGKPEMGVFAERSHRIIPTRKCYIQNMLIQKVANDIYRFVLENNISVYNEEKHSGEIRHIYIRIGIKTNEVLVVIVSNTDKITKENELVKYIVEKHPEIKTVVKNINSKKTNVILGSRNEVLYGNGYIEDELLGFKFKISPMSFYQVNPVQTEVLYTRAIEKAELTGTETIFDLYCGIGTIGICASKNAKKLIGIETIPEAIEDAKENAKLNKIENAEFIVGNVEEELPKLMEEEKVTPDVVFLDPPRKGCDKKTLETLLEIEPRKIVYISCNSATLARDLKILESKYKIGNVQPVDMFPYTTHVECVCALKLNPDYMKEVK